MAGWGGAPLLALRSLVLALSGLRDGGWVVGMETASWDNELTSQRRYDEAMSLGVTSGSCSTGWRLLGRLGMLLVRLGPESETRLGKLLVRLGPESETSQEGNLVHTHVLPHRQANIDTRSVTQGSEH